MITDVVLSDGTRIRRGEAYTESNREQDLYLKKIKYMEMADMKLSGMTYEAIAKKKGLTRQRIEQILKLFFPDIEFPNRSFYIPKIQVTCIVCGTVKEYPDYKMYRTRKYCNVKCQVKLSPKKSTPEEKREYWRNRTLAFYHSHKHLPHYIAKHKEYNRTAHEKRKQAKNKLNSKKNLGRV